MPSRIALILAHLRIDPELAVRIVKANWGDRSGGKRDDLDAAMRRGDITLADLIPAAREADRLADHIIVVVDFGGPLTGVPSLNYARASDLELIRQRPVDAHRGLFAIFDLSARLQEFSKALARGCPDRAGRPDRVRGRRGRPPAKAAPMMVSASDTVDIYSNAPFPLGYPDRACAPAHGPNGGVADSLDEAKAAFRAAGERRRPRFSVSAPYAGNSR